MSYANEGTEAQQFAITNKYVVLGRTDPKRGVKPEVDLTSIDPDMTVSRQHARIRYENTFFSFQDRALAGWRCATLWFGASSV